MAKSEHRGRVTLGEALRQAESAPRRFATLFQHGSLEVELYAPKGIDPQEPHTRDEAYVVARGNGFFLCGGVREPCGSGDFLFVPAGMEHRFVEFSEDFAAWVLFYGPEGGESP